MTDHPITPPPELYKQWEHQPRSVAFEAAYRAGADMELEASLAELKALNLPDGCAKRLRAARRPKPPSLKEQALRLVSDYGVPFYRYTAEQTDTIRRALEALPND
jgi:hypothetical protein